MSDIKEMVTLTIDGVELKVPKGTNLIEAAKLAGVSVPYYCYHPHLSVAGNCRMCQVEVQGMPKLTIGCNTIATEGMVVRTQKSSTDVANAQRAVLEFLLINHPLDCTVCDQAGHCKLQDYYYEYNSKPSRFIEEKVQKVKAEALGPEIVYDGERCIVCTRCVRFCDEVAETSELGVFNRGDKAVIGIHPDKELDNPLAGSVVDLCPVGALTHRRWRFNSRIWYTNQVDTICTGCSTGCSAKVAVRDSQIVQVKARLNSEVNQEWMCDEGRYGFERFQPRERLVKPLEFAAGEYRTCSNEVGIEKAAKLLQANGSSEAAVIFSPFLTLEEVWVTLQFAAAVMKCSKDGVGVQLVSRQISDVEKKLVSPDYAPNARAATIFGIGRADESWRESLEEKYFSLLSQIKQGKFSRLLFVGDFAVRAEDVDRELEEALRACKNSVCLTPRALVETEKNIANYCTLVLPTRTVHEKNGVMVNRTLHIQRLRQLFSPPDGTQAEWTWLSSIAESLKLPIVSSPLIEERALLREVVSAVPEFEGLSLVRIGELGTRLSVTRQMQAL